MKGPIESLIYQNTVVSRGKPTPPHLIYTPVNGGV